MPEQRPHLLLLNLARLPMRSFTAMRSVSAQILMPMRKGQRACNAPSVENQALPSSVLAGSFVHE